MKKMLLFSLLSVLLSVSLYAQNNVQLMIHHKLGSAGFAMNTAAKNNLGDDFNVTRLEYYISGISIVHDNGTVTSIDSLYILVDAAMSTEVNLGSYPIDHVEGIHFYIGVDPEHNHLDPASYDSNHPLAPKAPSMHWGWAAGYRFMAFEGNGGPQYNQLIQLHGLGDQNYIKTRVNLSTTASNNEVIINLDADYTRILEDISVNGGLIVHSETGIAQQALENLRNLVFSPSGVNTGTSDWNQENSFALYPNPTINGHAAALIMTNEQDLFDIKMVDIRGQQTCFLKGLKPNTNIDLRVQEPGVYIVQLLKKGIMVSTKKLISE